MIEIRKSMFSLGSILCLFVLVAISYQPIVADDPIIKPEHMLIEEYYIIDNGCSCEDNNWDFPIICWILERLWYLIPQFSPFPVPLLHWVIIIITETLGCQNIPP